MKNNLLIVLLLLFFLPFAGAQEGTSTKGQAASDKATAGSSSSETGLLWEVTGNGLDKPSYVYGTIHLIDSESFFLPGGTLGAFEASERVTFEINMEDMSDMSAIFSMMSRIMMANGTTLSDLLSDEDYNFVKSKFTEMGLPFMMFERMKPMFLSIFASTDMDPGAFTSGEMKSYEMEFMDMAKAQNKEMAGLETIEFQMSMFDSIPYSEQAEMLVESLKSTDDGEDQLKMMIELYKTQDIEKLQMTINEDEQGLGDYEDLLLTKRNQAWIPIMKKMMAEKPTFFAVGAGHLGGKNGVIQLLKDEGYSLQAIRK
jgi:uncharacterized protein YbaP (TraB family)